MSVSNTDGIQAEFHLDFASPLLFTAIHNGHELRKEVKQNCALSEIERLREEDPHTAFFTEIGQNCIILQTSRFEVDLNRRREKAIYLQPEDCWGLIPRSAPPDQDYLDKSLAEYDLFYQGVGLILDELIRLFDQIIIYDIHSYNHHRKGIDAPFDDPALNPEIILGTSNMSDKWFPKIEEMRDQIMNYDWYGKSLDCRINVKFTGGHFAQWIHQEYKEKACVISIEFKKIFMNEWTGVVDYQLMNELRNVLKTTIKIW